MDTPQQFVKDVVRADQHYAENFNTEFLMANFRFGDFLGVALHIPEEIVTDVSDKMFQPTVIRGSKKNAKIFADSMIEMIDHPPKCIDSYDMYQLMQYIAKVEAPWAAKFIHDTHVGKYIEVPTGVNEYMQKLANIPPCYE